MLELSVVVQVQSYNGEEEELEALQNIRDAVVAVVALADLSVGTFVVSNIKETEDA
jgi:hypothetical protein